MLYVIYARDVHMSKTLLLMLLVYEVLAQVHQ